MTVVTTSRILPAPIEAAWDALGDFSDWGRFLDRISHTTLEGGTGRGPVGAVRVLTLSDGSSVRERLVDYDQRHHELAYQFDGEHPFPVRDYVGRVRLWPVTDTNETFALWTGTFDCEADVEKDNAAVFDRIYTTFLAGLAAFLREPPA